MFKKFISFMLCFVMSLAVTATTLATSDYSIAEAAKVYETPYYYNQLTDNAKKAYKSLKEAVIECKKTLKINYEIDQEDFNKISELLILHDPMTFNLKDIEATSSSRKSVTFKMTYRYNKETYDKMVKSYEKEADEILSKLTEDMSTYKKIRTIHDSIIKNTVYDLDSKTNDTVYGALVKNKAKCDGYAKTFTYICGQAGIRTVTVIGDDVNNKDDTLHMWNKVYYNKKWYNVDVTWDDPISNVKNNLQYDYFMVSDKSLAGSHKEDNLSFEVPAATDNSKNYYIVNKKYAEDFDSAKSLIKNQLTSAAKKEKISIDFKCSSKSLYEKMKTYVLDVDKMCKVLESVQKKTNSDLIPTIYSYGFNDTQYIISVYIFYEDTDLDHYFSKDADVGADMKKALAQYGIK